MLFFVVDSLGVVDGVDQQEARDQAMPGYLLPLPTATGRKERKPPDGYGQRGTARFTAYRRDMHAAAAAGSSSAPKPGANTRNRAGISDLRIYRSTPITISTAKTSTFAT